MHTRLRGIINIVLIPSRVNGNYKKKFAHLFKLVNSCLPGKISGHVVTKYVNITDTIAVPAKWPAHVFRESLVQLVEQMIIALNSGKSVVLQVLNTPAKLVQCQDRNGIQYFFEKVFRECVFFHEINHG